VQRTDVRAGSKARRGWFTGTACVVGAAVALSGLGTAAWSAQGAAPASSALEVAGAALTPVGVVAAAPSVQPPGGVAGVPVPRIRWTPIADGFQQARFAVPYDYRTPKGKTFSLYAVRLPATEPKRRLGAIVYNFGGPGGGAAATIQAAAKSLPAALRARYDIVGVDPRGTGASTPVRCSRSEAEQAGEPLAGVRDFPENAKERGVAATQAKRLADRCRALNGDLLDHVGTLQFARDLDVLRAAMGDKKLNFYGLSYGTFLGQVLVNTFPTRVGRVVLDGVVNPGWAVGAPTTVSWNREGYDLGAWETLQEFFRQCDAAGPQLCAFAGGGKARYDALADRLRTAPVALPVEEGQPPAVFGYSELVVLSQGLLYQPSSWPVLGGLLQALSTAPPAVVAKAVKAARLVARGGAAYDNFSDALLAISCADTDNPRDPSVYAKVGAVRDSSVAPYFGSRAAYTAFPCFAWKGRSTERYTGPWNRATAGPVLIIGTRFDPATPYRNAIGVAEQLPNSRLLTLDGAGHTAFGLSTCIEARVTAYFVSGTLPRPGTACTPDASPFAPPTPATQADKKMRVQRAPGL